MREHGVDFGIAAKYDLGYVARPIPGDERFTGMLSIPYVTSDGVRALKFRSLSAGGSKYAQHNGQQGRLFNAPAYFEAGTTIGISEGEMDAIAATEYLEVPTLGVPGANGWKNSWKLIFKDFTTVLVFADGDQPGRDFADEVATAIGWRARIIQCPDFEDVSSMAASGRASELLAKISTRNEEE